MNISNLHIAKDIKAGDKLTFEKVYAYFQPKLSYFASQYILQAESAENIVQDVFTELWDRRKTLDDNSNIQAWLFTVTKNKSLKFIRKEKNRQEHKGRLLSRQLEANYRSLTEFDTSDFLFEELQQKINEALEKLSPSVRIVFEKSRFEDKKNKEIAEELGISIKTVEAHITKSLKLLQSELEDYLPLIYILTFLK